MKKILFVVCTCIVNIASAQVLTDDIDYVNNPELMTSVNQAEQLIAEDADLYINKSNVTELIQSGLFSEVQAKEIVNYREQFGFINTIEEMQQLENISITQLLNLKSRLNFEIPIDWKEYAGWKKVSGQMITRFVLPLTKNESNSDNYIGSLNRSVVGLKLNFGKNISFTYNGEKDGGEKFQFSKSIKGFDFHSMHLTFRNAGKFEKIIIGDYQIQFGQGLVVWQGLSLGKTSEIVSVYKQESGIKDYNSLGEYGFFRGIATSYQLKKSKITSWFSYDFKDASLYEDSISGLYYHSYKTDGYHRIQSEINNKNTIKEIASGISYAFDIKQMKFNYVTLAIFNNQELKKENNYYQLFAEQGKHFFNQSISFSGIKNNTHYFGEYAWNINGGAGFVSGFVSSIQKNISVSILHRYYSKSYHALYANGFSENSKVNNEAGLYFGINYSFNKKLTGSVFYDQYKFPWLKYGVDMPSSGHDYLLNVNYSFCKTSSFNFRLQKYCKEVSNDVNESSQIEYLKGSNYRFQFRTEQNRLQLTFRLDFTKIQSTVRETGVMAYADVIYKPFLKPWSFAVRASLYRTGSYTSRLYAYQSDLPGSYNLGVFYGNGEAIYAMIRYKINRQFSVWLKGSRAFSWTQVSDFKKGLPEYECKFQVLYQFGVH